MRVNCHCIIVVPSNSCTFMNQTLCMDGDEMYVGRWGGAAREPDSSSCEDVEPWRADWLRARTHPRRAQCPPGPLEPALVTPHKSIQSLKSRRGESGRRGLRRSGPGSHFRRRLVSARAGRGGDLMSPHRAGVSTTVIDRAGEAP